MKKLFLTLAATAMCTTAFAGTRILYQQNFETAADVAATGWTYGGGSATIASDDYGKFLELSLGQNNGRTGYVDWGTDIFMDANGESVLENGTYKVKFDFSIKTNSNNQYNSEITLFTTAKGTDNQPFRGRWSGDVGPWNNFLFDAYQANTAADADMLVSIDAPYKATTTTNEDGTETTSYSVDLAETYTLATGNWYTVECDVDVNARTVDYTVIDLSGNMLTQGTLNVPETSLNADQTPVSMYAQGIWVMTARYQTTMDFDNIEVSYESNKDVANPPTVAMTRLGKDAEDVLNLNLRAYTITFLNGETLHVTGTEGQTVEVEWADCDGAYVYETSTSGTLKAWTTCGTATSEVVEMEVECVPVVLPAATATISAVAEGYGKTYTLTVSSADVPLQPTIFINYKFVGKSGNVVESEGEASGVTVTVTEEGVLSVTTEAYGYQATTTSVDNDLEFATKQKYDFARMSQEDLTAAGFTTWQELNSSSTSGFSNWTARKRLFYYDSTTATVDEETGETVYTAVYPFGYVSEDGPVLNYSEIGVEGDDLGINVAGYELFPGINVFAGHNVTALLHVGVTNNATSGGNNKNIDVLNLDETDFVVYNTIGSYGSDSNHPVVATAEEYYAQLAGTNNVVRAADGTLNEETGKYTVSCPIYRIDTVCTCLTVFAQIGGGGNVEGVEAEVAGDNYYYTIDGLRLAEPTRPGLYIHNGKKIIVK